MPAYNSRSRHFAAFAIWITGLIIFVLLSLWNISTVKKDAENKLINDATRTAGELANLIVISQWDLDEPSAKAIMNGAMDDERIYAIKITKDHKMLAGQRRNYLWEPVPWDDEITEYTIMGMHSIKMGNDVLGRVELWLSPRLMREEISMQINREVIRSIIISILWTCALLIVLWQWGDFMRFRKFLNRKPPDPDKIILGLAKADKDDGATAEKNAESPLNPQAGRFYQRTNPEAWLITCGMFKQTFSHAPNLMSRLFSDGDFAGLCRIGRMLEKAAPCLGAENLAKAAKEMQKSLNDPSSTARALPVEQCVYALEEVLEAISGKA